jgi:hypothetical protein
MRTEYWRNVYTNPRWHGCCFMSQDIADQVAHQVRKALGPRAYRIHIKLKEPMVGK